MQPHPAPFSQPILAVLRELMQGESRARVLDPFGGTGRVLDALPPGTSATIIDVEAEFLNEGIFTYADRTRMPGHIDPITMYEEINFLHRGINSRWIAADSRVHLKHDRKMYTHIITSPAYGNRYTDGFNPTIGRKCRSYAQSKGGSLDPANGGRFKFNTTEYMDLHWEVMDAAIKRLRPGGDVIVNVSDFYKTKSKGAEPQRQMVVAFWTQLLHDLGLNLYRAIPVVTRRYREGENRHRAEYEIVLIFKKENIDVRKRTR